MHAGKTYWVPVGDTVSVNNFTKWEQAFRVFLDIYNRHHPHRSTELIQYNHMIHTASLTYIWDNVCAYDKDFRLHMARYPDRSWGIILQQAWAMRLKDKIFRHDSDRYNNGHRASSGSSHGHQNQYQGHSGNGDCRSSSINVNDICCRFN